jgi:hypothetical protein
MRIAYQRALFLVLLCCGSMAAGQATTAAVVPALTSFSGVLTDLNGKPLTGVVGVTLSLYKEQQGGAPLWVEVQNVKADRAGHYTVTLGATRNEGLPANLFVSGDARWLGVQAAGLPEQARVMLLAVPYALKAGDAQTIGGLPPSAFLLAAPTVNGNSSAASSNGPAAAAALPPASSNVTTTGGTVNAVPLFTTATNIQKSILTQTGATAINVAGKLNLPAQGTAAATGGKFSRPEDFVASSFNSTSAIAVPQTFQLQAAPAGNNTAAPFATLDLMYGSGTATPTETGLKFNNKGLITFAAGQTFPGTGKGTITGVTAGTGLLGGGTSGIVALNLDATKVPELGSNNAFSGTEQFKGAVGVGTTPMANGYTPLSIGSANGFGTWFAIANTSAGGHTWNIISAGAGNAEGAGNFGITDLTGKSTIWLEGNTRTTSLTASGGVNAATLAATTTTGAAIVDADAFGTNTGALTPGLRFGGGSSGEGIASNRVAGINRFGLQLFTEFTPRLSILQDGRVGIGATHPTAQLEVDSPTDGYAAIFAQGGAAANGSGENGSAGIVTYGNTGDLSSSSSVGGDGIDGYGASGNNFGGSGGSFTAGSYGGNTAPAIWGQPAAGNDPYNSGAGFFNGNILVGGSVDSADISFPMDHPLDPANKYLYHSAVQSSDMKNIYDGNVTSDASGTAAVELPEWIEAVNRDFRYQLTTIGQPAQAWIASKIANHVFIIRTDKPNVEISWQITGIRQDAWANAHRIPVEANKNDRERGFYLHPELYGAPQESGIEWARHPQMMKRLKEIRQNKSRTLQSSASQQREPEKP